MMRKIICYISIIAYIAAMTVGCSKDDSIAEGEKENTLTFSMVLGKPTQLRSEDPNASAADKKVNPKKVWIFVANAGTDDIIMASKCLNSSNNRFEVPIPSNAKATMQSGEKDFILVANANFDITDMPTKMTQVKNKLVMMENINTGNEASEFAMTAQFTANVGVSKDLGKQMLNRVIAKVRVNKPVIRINGYEEAPSSTPEFMLINYADQGKLITTDNDAPLRNMREYKKMVNSFEDFYSFYNSWENNADRRSYLLLKLPLKNASTGVVKNYYYKIKLGDRANVSTGDEINKLEPNHVYLISLKILILGSLDEVNPMEISGDNISIKDYTMDAEEDIDIARAQYLQFASHKIQMVNQTEIEITYKTSSNINNFTVEKCYYKYVNDKGKEITEEVHAVDNNGQSDPQYPTISDENGKVKIKLDLPVNSVPKNIIIKGKNGDNAVDIMEITQYPNMYIEYTLGEKSILNETGEFPDWLNNKAMYYIRVVTPPKKGADGKYPYYLGFPTRMKSIPLYTMNKNRALEKKGELNSVCNFQDKNNDNLVSPSFELASQLGATFASYFVEKADYERFANNYVQEYKPDNAEDPWVNINTEYITGPHGNKGDITKDYNKLFYISLKQYQGKELVDVIEKDKSNLPSPYYRYAFIKYDSYYALLACAYYTETRVVDGREVVLDDWRLPTKAEILLINELQHKEKGAVKAIMTGSHYWSSSGERVKLEGSKDKGLDELPDKAYIRCVRDVKDKNF